VQLQRSQETRANTSITGKPSSITAQPTHHNIHPPTQVTVDRGDSLEAGDLVVFVESSAPPSPPLSSLDGDAMAAVAAEAAAKLAVAPMGPAAGGAAAVAEAAAAAVA